MYVQFREICKTALSLCLVHECIYKIHFLFFRETITLKRRYMYYTIISTYREIWNRPKFICCRYPWLWIKWTYGRYMPRIFGEKHSLNHGQARTAIIWRKVSSWNKTWRHCMWLKLCNFHFLYQNFLFYLSMNNEFNRKYEYTII